MKANKELVQSYASVFSCYKSNIYEERLLTKIVESLQSQLEGERLNGVIEHEFKNGMKINISIKDLSYGEQIPYRQIIDAIKSISKKEFNRTISFENKKKFDVINMVSSASVTVDDPDDKVLTDINFNISDGIIDININKEFVDFMLDFTSGFRRYEMIYLFKMKSSYTARLYKMISGQERVISHSLYYFKKMLGIEDKYPNVKDLKRLLDRAIKELINIKAPYIFKYKIDGINGVIHIFPEKYIMSKIDKKIDDRKSECLGLQACIGDNMWKIFRDYKFSSILLIRNRRLIQEFHDIPNSIGILYQIMEENKDKSTFKTIVLKRIKRIIEKQRKKEKKSMITKTIEDSYFDDGMEYV